MTSPIAYRNATASLTANAYHHVVTTGGFAYLAGQLAADQAGNPARLGDIAEETRIAMGLLRSVLAEVGLTFADVVRVGVYMTDLSEFVRMNAVYVTYFETGRLPARTTVGVASLLEGCRIEIDCVARLREG